MPAETKTISYTIRRSRRARNMRLEVRRDGTVVVTIPFYMPRLAAVRCVRAHRAWIAKRRAALRGITAQPRHTPAEIRAYTKAARTLAAERIAHVNQQYHFSMGRIAIRNQRTRWGSCSKKKNLNFNYRIALLPAELAEYIIVHELCHTREFNHSKKFWALVSETVPEYKVLRIRLRKEFPVYAMG